MRFMVRYDTDLTIELLEQIGQIAYRSSLVNWLALEADESDEQRIAQVPGVLEVYPEREGVWIGDGWMLQADRQLKLNTMRELLPRAEADLAYVRARLRDKPALRAICEPSALELVRRVKEQIKLLEGEE